MTENKIPPPPEKPTPHECCASGCVPCIYDYYYDALDKWNDQYGDNTNKAQRDDEENDDVTNSF